MQVNSITLPVQFTPGSYAPAVDYTGAAVGNLVSGELQEFDPNPDTAHTFIMPSFAPFFAQGLVVQVETSPGVFATLTPLTDYTLVFPFLGASRSMNKAVFGGIRFNSVGSTTTVKLAYQTLGGLWVTGQTANATSMLDEQRHPGAVAMEQVGSYPSAFPNVGQPWDRQDPKGMPEVILQLEEMTGKIRSRHAARNYAPQIAHLSRQDNPHAVNKSQVGLGLIANYGPASAGSAMNPLNDAEYISTGQIYSMMQNWVIPASALQQGVAKLNLGINPGDDSDTQNALTAAGFTNITSNSDSAIARAFNKGQLTKVVNPFPFTYPIIWRGTQYAELASFKAAVEAYVGVSPLEYNANNGVFWFPANTTLPDLTVTPA